MLDLLIVLLYLFITLTIGFLAGSKITSIKEFAVSNKNYSNKVLIATLFATFIGGGSTLGITTNVYQYGLLFLIAYYGTSINKILVGFFVAPKISRYSFATSIGDIFEYEYGKIGRVLSGVFATLCAIAITSYQILAVCFIFEVFFDLSFIQSIILGYGVVLLYSSFGGIRAVVWTDVFQFILILGFIPIILISSTQTLGDFSIIINSLPQEKLSIILSSDLNIKALTLFLMMTFGALDPAFIQRLVLCKDEKQAQYICKFTGILSIPFFTAMGFLGLITIVLSPDINPQYALPYLINTTLPVFLKGFAIASLLAVLMSSIDASVHVSGLSLVQDIYIPLKIQKVSEAKKLKLVRLVTLFTGLCSALIAIYFKNILSIMIFAFSFWGPTVLVPFIFALYGLVFTPKQFSTGVVIGFFTVLIWNFLLKDISHFDGFIPGIIINSLYFFWLKHQNKTTLIEPQPTP